MYKLDLLAYRYYRQQYVYKEEKKMSEAFERHRDKRISELRERMRNSKIKRKIEMRTFGQRVEKAWKNINEIKSN